MTFAHTTDSSKSDLRTELNIIASQSIVPVSFWLGVLYVFFSVVHLFFLPQGIALSMCLIAAFSALILFSVTIMARRKAFSPSHAHPIIVGMMELVLVNSLIHMLLTRDVLQSTNVRKGSQKLILQMPA